MRKSSILFFIFLLSSQVTFSNVKILSWKVHTSFNNPKQVTADNQNRLFFATQGGVLIYNPKTGDEYLINSGNGLWDNDITEIYYSEKIEKVIAGSNTGAITFIDKEIKLDIVLDITKSNFPDKSINTIIAYGNTLYIGTGFGLVTYDMDKNIFRETIGKMGEFSINIPVKKAMMVDGKIYLATSEGVCYADINSQLANPSSWKTINANNQNDEYLLCTSLNFDKYFSTKNDIYKLENDSLVHILYNEYEIQNLGVHQNNVYFADAGKIYKLDKNYYNFYPAYPAKKMLFGYNLQGIDNNTPLFLYRDNGIGYFADNKLQFYSPNSPASNLFFDLETDKSGNLWVGTGELPSKGFMKFDGTNWLNYTVTSNPKFLTDNAMNVLSYDDTTVYISTWGKGLLKFNPNNQTELMYFTSANSPIVGYDEDWFITGQIKLDRNNTLWTVNYGESTQGPVLISMDNTGKFNSYNSCISINDRFRFALEIDGNNTKWIGSTNGSGLLYLNENGTPDDKSDDICGVINSSSYSNLPDNTQNALAIDQSGSLWIGTPEGLASVYNPSAILLKQKPIIRSLNSLSQQAINDIYVDAVNNKWLATNEGVWVLNPDATEIIDIINTENSPLKTNRIRSITGNTNEGKIFIGTDIQLLEANTLFVAPLDKYSLLCYPQPFNFSTHSELIIDGLAVDSEVWVTTTSGSIVKRFSTSSRRIVWDGLDENSNKVQTGVYLLNTQSRTGNQSSLQKITIINN